MFQFQLRPFVKIGLYFSFILALSFGVFSSSNISNANYIPDSIEKNYIPKNQISDNYYKDETQGFELEYPAGWFVYTSNNVGNYIDLPGVIFASDEKAIPTESDLIFSINSSHYSIYLASTNYGEDISLEEFVLTYLITPFWQDPGNTITIGENTFYELYGELGRLLFINSGSNVYSVFLPKINTNYDNDLINISLGSLTFSPVDLSFAKLYDNAFLNRPVIINESSGSEIDSQSLPSMRMPWDKSNTYSYTSGPHGAGDTNYSLCNPYSLGVLAGIDFNLNTSSEVLSVAPGTVTYWSEGTNSGVGNYVQIDHGSGWVTQYWHLSVIDQWVKDNLNKSNAVVQGQVIGKAGGTGGWAVHLHLQLRYNSAPIGWNGLTIDGYTVRSIYDANDNSRGLNYQGTLTKGSETLSGTINYVCSSSMTRPGRKWSGSSGTVEAIGGPVYSSNTRQMGGTTPPSSNCPNYSYNGIVLFENSECNVNGGSKVEFSSTGRKELPSLNFNDKASSIHVAPGWSVKVYEHDNGGGSSRCVSNTFYDLSKDYFTSGNTGLSLNDQISSVDVFTNTTCTGSTTGTWNGAFYDTIDRWWDNNNSGNYRCSSTISGPFLDQNYGIGAPCGMDGDTWVGEYTATINFAAGNYVFRVDHDDGLKLWLNGNNIADRGGSGSGNICPPRYLSGNNNLKAMLREDGGDARIKVNWTTDTSLCVVPPPSPSLISPSNNATVGRGDTVTLSWNTSSGATKYYAEFWGGPGFAVNSGEITGTSYTVGSTFWGGVYQWRVKAINSAGYNWSETRTLYRKYGSPSNLTLSDITQNRVRLTWNASADAPGNIAGYRIYRNGSPIATVNSSTTTYDDNGATCGTNISYYVKAYKDSLESDPSETRSATTSACGAGVPSLISPNDNSYYDEGQEIILSWSATGTEYYGEITGGPSLLTFGWQTATSKNIGSQWAGYTYAWRVKARNSGGESAYSGTRTFTVRPGIPTNFTAAAASCSQVNLGWSDNSGNEEGYKVYRNGSLIATRPANSTSFSNTGVTEGTNYSYVVRAYRSNIESRDSSTQSVTTPYCPPATPIMEWPSNAQYINSRSVILQWQQPASNGLSGYDLRINTSSSPNTTPFILDTFVSGAATTNRTIDFAADGTYYWHIRSRNVSGQTSSWASRNFTIDTVLPVASITNPATASLLSGTSTIIRVTATDNTAVKEVEFHAYYGNEVITNGTEISGAENITEPLPSKLSGDQELIGTAIGERQWYFLGRDTNGSDGWSYSWNYSDLPDQEGVAVFAFAFDKADNYIGTGNFDLLLLKNGRPSNDNLSNAVVINSLPFSLQQSSYGATTQVNEPAAACGYNLASSVWYRYTPTITNFVMADAVGSDYDTVINIVRQNSTGGYTGVNCNDDSDGAFTSKAAFLAQAGTSYYIGVSHYGGGKGGALNFHLEQIPCSSSSLCMVVTNGYGIAARYPAVIAKNSYRQGYGYGDQYGFVEIAELSAGTYSLTITAHGTYISKSATNAPGKYAFSALGLPSILVEAKDTASQPIGGSIVLANSNSSSGFIGYTGYTHPGYPLKIHASPGTYSVSITSNTSKYILTKKDLVISSNTANLPVTLDASVMPVNTMTFNIVNADSGSLYGTLPYSGYWYSLGIQNGESVKVSIPEGSELYREAALYKQEPVTGNSWEYAFLLPRYPANSGNITETVGGTISLELDVIRDPYQPGDTGILNSYTEDSYGHQLIGVYKIIEGEVGSSSLSNRFNQILSEPEPQKGEVPSTELTGQDYWETIVPSYSIQDAGNQSVQGYFYYRSINAYFYFDIGASPAMGIWRANAVLDLGPYQSPVSDNNTFEVKIIPPPTNDDFDNRIQINNSPWNAIVQTSSATMASDDPVMGACNNIRGQATIWYQFTPSANGTLHLHTIGSDYDTVLAVWKGNRGSLTLIGCNDDRSTTPHDITSELMIPVVKGTTYMIEVAEWVNPNVSGAAIDSPKYFNDLSAQIIGGRLELHAQFLNPIATLTALNPSGIMIESGDQTVIVRGKDFVPGAQVSWNGEEIATTFTSNELLSIFVPAHHFLALGTVDVWVTNPAPGGGISNSLKFVIGNVQPAPDTTALTRRPVFDWPDVEGATSYELQIATARSFSTILMKRISAVSTNIPISDLPQNRIIYWRVRPKVGGVYKAWSVTYSFRSANPPSRPTLQSPATNALTTSYTPRLTWSASTLPSGVYFEKYHLQITSDTSFSNIDVERDIMSRTTPNYVVQPGELQPNLKYYWRVRSINTLGHYSNWSPVFSLRSAMLKPELLLPIQGETTLVLRPYFDWEDVYGATGYTIQLSTYSNFSTILTKSSPSVSSYTATINLPKNKIIYWRVRGNGPNGPTLWTTGTFKSANPPSTPSLVSPSNTVTLKTRIPKLDWSTSTLPVGILFDHYQLQVATDSKLTNIILDMTLYDRLDSQYLFDFELNPKTRYYWRVRSINTLGHESSWSSIWYFMTP
jgi:murein DD-endopeptidase MepM/ murein hydrolase activator NlpD